MYKNDDWIDIDLQEPHGQTHVNEITGSQLTKDKELHNLPQTLADVRISEVDCHLLHSAPSSSSFPKIKEA